MKSKTLLVTLKIGWDKSMRRKTRSGIVALVFALASVGAAHADAVLSFTAPTLNIAAGGTVEFDGTLTNTGTEDLYLNGDVIILNYPDLTDDDSPFFADSPLFLSPGDSYTGPFIDVTADATIASGSYDGSYTIQGGADPETFDDIATENFTVDVGSSSITPEPNSLLLLATGLAILTFARYFLMRRSAASTLQKSADSS
jgi:hypothetical protein